MVIHNTTVVEGQKITAVLFSTDLCITHTPSLDATFFDCHSFHIFSFPTYSAEAQDYLRAVLYKTSSL